MKRLLDAMTLDRWSLVGFGVSVGLNAGAVLKNVQIGRWEVAGASATVLVAVIVLRQVTQLYLARLRAEMETNHAQVSKLLVEQQVAETILARVRNGDDLEVSAITKVRH